MALYNVGDRVVVREGLGTNSENFRYGYGDGMEEFCGRTVTIAEVYNNYGDENRVVYKLGEDPNGWQWGSADFVGLADNSTPRQTVSKEVM